MENQFEKIFKAMEEELGNSSKGFSVGEIRAWLMKHTLLKKSPDGVTLVYTHPVVKEVSSTADQPFWYSNYISSYLNNLCLKRKKPKFRRERMKNGNYRYFRIKQ